MGGGKGRKRSQFIVVHFACVCLCSSSSALGLLLVPELACLWSGWTEGPCALGIVVVCVLCAPPPLRRLRRMLHSRARAMTPTPSLRASCQRTRMPWCSRAFGSSLSRSCSSRQVPLPRLIVMLFARVCGMAEGVLLCCGSVTDAAHAFVRSDVTVTHILLSYRPSLPSLSGWCLWFLKV